MNINSNTTEAVKNFISLDLEYYKSKNLDLNGLSSSHLRQHYSAHGYREGRASSEFAHREKIINFFSNSKALEIGPFYAPLLNGKNVKYFDVLTKTEMTSRAKELGFITKNIPEIDFVHPEGDITIVKEKFDVVISAHNIEHQPDIISHLKAISGLLNNNGKYALIIPHSKFCFDAKLPVTKISEIFNAHFEKRVLHSVGSIIEHRAMTTHNDPKGHWDAPSAPNFIADIVESQFMELDSKKIKAAIEEYKANEGQYIDVHAWQFTPLSFCNIIKCLIEIEYIDFQSVEVFGPVFGRNEFTAIISKDKKENT